MEVAFDSRSLRSICEDQALAMEEFGAIVAEALKHRLADIHAADTLNELPISHRCVAAEEGEHIVIDLGAGYSIALAANHRRNPTGKGGEIEWGMVSRLKVMRIGRDDD